MSIVNYFVYDLINKNEIFSNALLIEYATVIPKHLHHSIDNVHHVGGRNIVFGSRNKINAKLFCEEVVEALDILNYNQKIVRKEWAGYLRMMEVGLRDAN